MTVVGPAAVSARESEVLDALGAHLTNAQIAQKLNISVRTVESHVSSLLRKLGAADRRDLATRASEVVAAAAPRARRPVVGVPARWTSFVGRGAILDELQSAVADARLVTLVGPGGIGKTTLAAVAAGLLAEGFDGGGAFVDLVPVSAEFVGEAVGAALGIEQRPQEPLEDVVHERLRAGRTLLVLDNCEHVLEAAGTFAQGVLAACPTAVVLATSRERLGIAGERVVAVPPLALAAADAGAGGAEAEALFADRAAAAGAAPADPTLVSEICRRLDGMPLAIELAAARSGVLGIDGLLAGLDDRLRLLSSGPSGRHQSLRAVIDWSHDLLDDQERALFRRLAAFAGPFDLGAASVVAGDGDLATTSDLIGRLADKQLLVHVPDGPASRWRLLETVHAYASERLASSGEAEALRVRHLAWAASAAADLESRLDDGDGWPAAFDAVVDDLRAALAASAAGPDPVRHGLALSLAHLSYARRFLVHARHHYESAVASAPDEASAVAALYAAGDQAYAEMRGDLAFRRYLEAAERAEAAGDHGMAAIALADAVSLGGRCPATFDEAPAHEQLVALARRARELAPGGDDAVELHVRLAEAWSGRRAYADADPERAEAALALAREVDDPICISNALDAVGCTAMGEARYRRHWELMRERVGLLDRMRRHDPHDGFEVADVHHMVVEAAMGAGLLEQALDRALRAREDPIARGFVHFSAAHLVTPRALRGELDEALADAALMEREWDRAGRPAAGWMAPSFCAAGMIHGLRGDLDEAERWWAMGDAACSMTLVSSMRLFATPRVALHLGDLDTALRTLLVPGQDMGGHYDLYAEAIAVEVAIVAGAERAGEARLATALSTIAPENDVARAILLRAAGRLHDDEDELLAAVAAWEALGARFERAATLLLLPDRAEEGRAELDALRCVVP